MFPDAGFYFAGRAVISLVFNHVFDVRSYDLGGAYFGTELRRPVYVKLPSEAGRIQKRFSNSSKPLPA